MTIPHKHLPSPLGHEQETHYAIIPVGQPAPSPLSWGYYRDARHSQFEEDIFDDFKKILETIYRRKGTILLLTLVVLLNAALNSLMTEPLYEATTKLQINDDNIKVLDYSVETDNQYWSNKDFYETQYELLKSRALARRTIDELNLYPQVKQPEVEVAPSFAAEAINNIKNLIRGNRQDGSPKNIKLGSFPDEDRFLGSLTVEPVGNSKLVMVHYLNSDPEKAATIVNTLAENYVAMNLEMRGESVDYAKNFLNEQLTLAKSRLEESEAELVKYTKQQDLISTDDTGNQTLTSQKLTDLHTALTGAERDRISAESDYKQSYSDNQSKITAGLIDSPVVEELKKKKAELQVQYQEQLQTYKPEYPPMLELQSQIKQLNRQIGNETGTARKQLQAKFQVDKAELKAKFLAAKEKEDTLHAELDKQKALLLEVRDKSIRFNTLKRDVETNRNLYEGLLQRIKEVGVAGGVTANNITIVDRALVPYSKYSPNVRQDIMKGLLLGLFIGVVTAFIIEYLDDRIKNSRDLENLLGLPLLGITPALKTKDVIEHSMATRQNPTSATAEAFRSLRTNLLFATKAGLPRSLLVTSAMPSEAKSSTCINLATVLAQNGKRVLLVDADLRKPSLHQRFKLDNTEGLSNYLTHQSNLDDVVQDTFIPGVSLITSGPLSPNPAELLSSERLNELLAFVPHGFDIVIMDSPPVMGLADSLILANQVSATILVAAFAQSKKRTLLDSFKRLKQANASIIGVVFTKMKRGTGYGYNYDYNYKYYYQYGAERRGNKSVQTRI